MTNNEQEWLIELAKRCEEQHKLLRLAYLALGRFHETWEQLDFDIAEGDRVKFDNETACSFLLPGDSHQWHSVAVKAGVIRSAREAHKAIKEAGYSLPA